MLRPRSRRAAPAPSTAAACARSGTGAAVRAPTRRRRAGRACPRSRSRRRAGRGRGRARRGAASGPASSAARARRRPPRRARRPPRAWPSMYGDFRSTKFAIASSASSNRSPESTTASAGSASITASQVPTASRPGEDQLRLVAHELGERGVELLAAPARVPASLRRLDAADAVRDLDELRELREPRGERHSVAAELARPAAPVPLLVGGAERLEHRRPAARAARRARAPWRRGGRSCRRPRGGPRARTRARPGTGAAAGCPEPSSRTPAAAARTLRNSWSYLSDFSAMSSPNHFACSCASEWQPTLTSSAV